ncbi:MAG: response regulator [Chloroflexi bacterium]|nr:MAG: response regulator [Chloroflexota bacterium]
MDKKPLALIIEDNEDQNLIFTTALANAGFDTISISDGAVAQQKISETPADVIVLDLHLPSIHGEILLKQIRKSSHLSEVRIILATADGALASTLKSQVDLVLLKPISFTQLNKLASRFLNHPKSDDGDEV